MSDWCKSENGIHWLQFRQITKYSRQMDAKPIWELWHMPSENRISLLGESIDSKCESFTLHRMIQWLWYFISGSNNRDMLNHSFKTQSAVNGLEKTSPCSDSIWSFAKELGQLCEQNGERMHVKWSMTIIPTDKWPWEFASFYSSMHITIRLMYVIRAILDAIISRTLSH